jgi:hypothetical protein
MTAIPKRSEPELAAVPEVFGTVLVLVSITWILDVGTLKTRLATFNSHNMIHAQHLHLDSKNRRLVFHNFYKQLWISKINFFDDLEENHMYFVIG